MNEDLQDGIRTSLSSFLADFPLYKGLEIFDIYVGLDERDISFNSYCEIDKEITTFIINNSDPKSFKSELKQSGKFLSINATYNYHFTNHCSSVCQKCQKFQRQFLIYGETLRPKGNELKFIIRKVGQYPAQEINPDKLFSNFLTPLDIELYKKAKMNLNYNHGIGAFAYFRRIVENEIKNVANKLIENNQDAKVKLEVALERYLKDHQMKKLIASLTPFLPKNVFVNGQNPLLKLYAAISEGLHKLSEDECHQRSVNIETLLRHVIIELRNQQSRDAAEKAHNYL